MLKEETIMIMMRPTPPVLVKTGNTFKARSQTKPANLKPNSSFLKKSPYDIRCLFPLPRDSNVYGLSDREGTFMDIVKYGDL